MRSLAIERGADGGSFGGPGVRRNTRHEPAVEMDVRIASGHLDEVDSRPHTVGADPDVLRPDSEHGSFRDLAEILAACGPRKFIDGLPRNPATKRSRGRP